MPLVFVQNPAIDVTPNWKGDSADPAIVNGTIGCKVMRKQKSLYVSFRITMGSSTTFGTGNWYLTLPAPYDANAIADALGQGFFSDNGVGLGQASAYIAANTNKIYMEAKPANALAANFVNAAVPITWANGDYIALALEYPIA